MEMPSLSSAAIALVISGLSVLLFGTPTGSKIEETKRNIQEVITLHLEGMYEDGEPIPPARTLISCSNVTASGK